MIPSRGSIQVTVEEDSGAGASSGSGTARAIYNSINNDNNGNFNQVKILRRPKPVACNAQNDDSNTSKDCCNNKTEVLFSQQTSTNGSRIVNRQPSDNRIKINNFNDNNKQQNSDLLLFKPGSNVNTEGSSISGLDGGCCETTANNVDEEEDLKIKKVFNRNGSTNQLGRSEHCYGSSTNNSIEHTQHSQHRATSNDNNSSLFNNSKHLMKTYQERADKYARARLRILGSAFPEDEQDHLLELSNNDKLNRIINLNSNHDNNSTIENITSTASSSTTTTTNSSNNILTKTNKLAPTYSSVTAANVSQQTIKP